MADCLLFFEWLSVDVLDEKSKRHPLVGVEVEEGEDPGVEGMEAIGDGAASR